MLLPTWFHKYDKALSGFMAFFMVFILFIQAKFLDSKIRKIYRNSLNIKIIHRNLFIAVCLISKMLILSNWQSVYWLLRLWYNYYYGLKKTEIHAASAWFHRFWKRLASSSWVYKRLTSSWVFKRMSSASWVVASCPCLIMTEQLVFGWAQ